MAKKTQREDLVGIGHKNLPLPLHPSTSVGRKLFLFFLLIFTFLPFLNFSVLKYFYLFIFPSSIIADIYYISFN